MPNAVAEVFRMGLLYQICQLKVKKVQGHLDVRSAKVRKVLVQGSQQGGCIAQVQDGLHENQIRSNGFLLAQKNPKAVDPVLKIGWMGPRFEDSVLVGEGFFNAGMQLVGDVLLVFFQVIDQTLGTVVEVFCAVTRQGEFLQQGASALSLFSVLFFQNFRELIVKSRVIRRFNFLEGLQVGVGAVLEQERSVADQQMADIPAFFVFVEVLGEFQQQGRNLVLLLTHLGQKGLDGFFDQSVPVQFDFKILTAPQFPVKRTCHLADEGINGPDGGVAVSVEHGSVQAP